VLLELRIKNFALIKEDLISFSPRLNVLTGETGAGKSIVIDAISLALGGRASTEFIKTGENKAYIDATFIIPRNTPIAQLLKDLEIDWEEEGYLILSREISVEGRNVCRVNGRPVTVGILKELGELLIDIHGQHEHQSLLKVDNHLHLLDGFGGSLLKEEKKLIAQLYDSIREKQRDLEEILGDKKELNRKVDMLEFQINEINDAGLSENEEEELRQEKKILSGAEKLFRATSDGYRLLYDGSEDSLSAVDLIGETLAKMEDAANIDSSLKEIVESLRTASYIITDVARELRDYAEGIEFSPEKVADIEERLYFIGKLKSKYGGSIQEILNYRNDMEKELTKLKNSEAIIASLRKEIASLEQVFGEKAQHLSAMRKKIAKELKYRVEEELKDLGMQKTVFEVRFTQKNDVNGVEIEGERIAYNRYGIDGIEFLISPNPGEPLKPLAKIASGGEMSRIMLALKTILAQVDSIPTLVFDEVDVGIGGRVSLAIGEKLSHISREHQVICVTHSPQIAACADKQIMIMKKAEENMTTVNIAVLSEAERIKELARMMGGTEITDTTIQHAQELLRMSKNRDKQEKK
jgi:DNA repair protein RecN (Recombination protein N)